MSDRRVVRLLQTTSRVKRSGRGGGNPRCLGGIGKTISVAGSSCRLNVGLAFLKTIRRPDLRNIQTRSAKHGSLRLKLLLVYERRVLRSTQAVGDLVLVIVLSVLSFIFTF